MSALTSFVNDLNPDADAYDGYINGNNNESVNVLTLFAYEDLSS